MAGPWERQQLLDRATGILDRNPRWLVRVVDQVLLGYHRPPADRARELSSFIELVLRGQTEDQELPTVTVRRRLFAAPAIGRARWRVPELATVADLAEFLEVTDGQLDWMADTRGLERSVSAEQLRHYRYTTRSRASGTVRVIEQPKQELKRIQRSILHGILDQIPVHDAAHGFTRSRSVRTHAGRHTGRFVVVRFDLQDFFALIAAGRIYGIFRTAGYPESVAHTLTALTTNAVPWSFWHSLRRPTDPACISVHHRLGRQLATPHLPQGAPTSPALANLAAFRLDRRLAGLATACDAAYTRYADDLTFSGPVGLVRGAERLRETVSEIAREEGFRINELKSTLATSAGRQRVCGIVVNERLNVSRDEYDLLKAILHNACRHGPVSQNRADIDDFRAHLLGRIAWVSSLNSERGRRLRRQFDRIEWSDE